MRDDWQAAMASGVPMTNWLRWVLHCEAKALNWDDPMLTLIRLWRRSAFRRIRKHTESGEFPIKTEPDGSV